MPTDSDLYRRWLEARDDRAFAELARRHADLVFDVAWRIGGDRHRAEDALQDSLLRLASDGSERPAVVGVRAWLARLALSRARNARASARARAKRERTAEARREERRMPDEARAAQQMVENALNTCDRDDAALLSMRYLHGLAYPELAAILGVAEPTVRVRVHRALLRLRKTARRDDLDETALAGLVAQVPAHTAPSVVVESAIASAIAGSTGVLAAATAGGTWLPRALTVAGVVVLVAGASLFWWSRGSGLSEDLVPAEPRAAAHASGEGTTLRGRPPLPNADAAPAAAPAASSAPTPLPQKVPAGGEAGARPRAADPSVPLHARLLLVHADGTEEELRISEIQHRGYVWAGEALETHPDAVRVLPGKAVALATEDDRAMCRRVLARVPASPSELVVRVPAKGSLDPERLELEIVDAETGLPIPDAWLEWGTNEEGAVRATADSRGRIRVRIPSGASWIPDREPALLRFGCAEHVVRAPGYLSVGHPWGLIAYVPGVRAEDLRTWMEGGVQRIALPPIPLDSPFAERTVCLLDAAGVPAEGAYVLVFHPFHRDLSPGGPRQVEFRRADARGRVSFPVHRVVGLEVRVDRIPIAAWALADELWPERGPRVLRLPPMAEVELVVEGVPEGTGGWARDDLGARRTPHDGPSFLPAYDPEATALLEGSDALLSSLVVDMARGALTSPRSTLRLPLPVGRSFTLHLRTGEEHRTWTVEAVEAGPLRLVRAWQDLPEAP